MNLLIKILTKLGLLNRGRSQDDPGQVLVLSPAVEHPRPESLRRLEYEYSLSGELDPTWAARSIEITHHRDRTALVMEDPGGMPTGLTSLLRGVSDAGDLRLQRVRFHIRQ